MCEDVCEGVMTHNFSQYTQNAEDSDGLAIFLENDVDGAHAFSLNVYKTLDLGYNKMKETNILGSSACTGIPDRT